MFKPISRRTLLRGAGTAMALPWLETMSRAATTAGQSQLAEPPMRMAFLFMPNGVRPDLWNPAGDGENFEFTRHLKPLEPFKDDILILRNLWHKKTVGRSGHWVKVPAWLSGGYVERTSGQDLNTGGTSVDQVAAERIGDKTMLPTFELGIEAPRNGVDNAGGGFARMYGSFISWRDPHTPVLKEIVPQLAFDRLYRNSSAPVISGMDANHSSVIDSLQRDRTSVLDLVMDELRSPPGDVHYTVLRPGIDVALERAASRAPLVPGTAPLTEEGPIRQLWASFQDLGRYESHVVDNGDLGPEETASVVWARFSEGIDRL